MSRQTYYTRKWENKNKYSEISLWIPGKAGEKTFCSRICHIKPLQLRNLGLRIHGKTSSHIKKVEANKSQSSLSKSFESSASSKVFH